MGNPAIFIHDTRRIVSVNDGACKLFRCEPWELIDRDMLDLVPEEYKDLTRLNLYTTRQGKGSVVKVREYDFVRCDGSKFHAAISSRTIDGDQFETTVTFKYNLP